MAPSAPPGPPAATVGGGGGGAPIVALIDEPTGHEAVAMGGVEGAPKAMEVLLEDGVNMTLEVDSGEKWLTQLGYKQTLQRSLTFWELFFIGYCTITQFTGIVPFYGTGLAYGGAVGAVWYWWIAVFFTHLIALSLAEIASSFPIAGSLYYWAAALAGKEHGPFAAWVTGWMEFLGLSVGFGGVAYGGTIMLQYTVLVATGGANDGGYLMTNAQSFAVTVGAIVLCGLANLLPIKRIGQICLAGGVFQVLLAVVLIIALPSVSDVIQPASYVFGNTATVNLGNLPTPAYSFVIAMQLPLYSLYAYDAAAHMAEETRKPDVTVPIAMVSSLSAMSLIGWLLLVIFTTCIYNPAKVFDTSGVTGGRQQVVEIIYEVFHDRTGSGTGAVVLLALIYVAFIIGVLAGVLAASRIAYALARDSGIPLSPLWIKVNKDKTPVAAVCLVSLIAIVFCIPLIFDQTVFYGITSLATVCWVGGYAIPLFFRMIQKESHFMPGPFYLAPYIGVTGRRIVNFLSIVFVLYTCGTFIVPNTFPVTAQNFNYSIVAMAVVLVFAMTWWFVDARFWFTGPLRTHLKDDDSDDD